MASAQNQWTLFEKAHQELAQCLDSGSDKLNTDDYRNSLEEKQALVQDAKVLITIGSKLLFIHGQLPLPVHSLIYSRNYEASDFVENLEGNVSLILYVFELYVVNSNLYIANIVLYNLSHIPLGIIFSRISHCHYGMLLVKI